MHTLATVNSDRKKGRKGDRKKGRKGDRKKGRKGERKKGRKGERKKGRKEQTNSRDSLDRYIGQIRKEEDYDSRRTDRNEGDIVHTVLNLFHI